MKRMRNMMMASVITGGLVGGGLVEAWAGAGLPIQPMLSAITMTTPPKPKPKPKPPAPKKEKKVVKAGEWRKELPK